MALTVLVSFSRAIAGELIGSQPIVSSPTERTAVSSSKAIENGEAIASDGDVLVLGEDHTNEGLAKTVLATLKTLGSPAQYNCLFIEAPHDVQDEVEAKTRAGDVDGFFKSLSKAADSAVRKGYNEVGFTDKDLETTEFVNIDRKTAPVDASVMEFSRRYNVPIIAYDSASSSPEFEASMAGNISELYLGQTKESQRRKLDAVSRRNQKMAANISRDMKVRSCKKAIVLVGWGHLLTTKYLDQYGIRNFKTLQSELKARDLKSNVAIVRRDPQAPKIRFEKTSEWRERFDDFTGEIRNP